MSFGFLSAGVLGLLVLALGPVLAHLARQRPVDRKPYGAMLLLRRLSRRLRRRRRIRDRLLLAARMAVVGLVVIGVARPELRIPGAVPQVGGSGRVVVVLDNSLSMSLQRAGETGAADARQDAGTLLAVARAAAVDLVEELPSGTLVGAVLTTSGAPGSAAEQGAARLTPTLLDDPGRVARALAEVGPTWEATDLDGALRQARVLLGGEPGDVVVFSDEAGPGVVASAREEMARILERGGAVIPRPVEAEEIRNLRVVQASYGDGIEGGTIRVVVQNYGALAREAVLTVTLPGGSEMTAFTEVPACEPEAVAAAEPCGRAEELFTVPRTVPGGVARVAIREDALRLDDRVWFHLPRVGASRVMVVDGDPGPTPIRSEVYFLERALAPWGGQRTGVTPDITALAGLHGLDPKRHRVVFMANAADPGSVVDTLSDFVRKGGGLVITAGDNVAPERYNAALSTLLPTPLRDVRNLVDLSAAGGVPVRVPQPLPELLQPFDRRGRAGFERVYFRRLVTLEPERRDEDVRTLLELENGLPLLVERRVGRGRVLLLTGTVDLAWGNLPLQSVFLPFVQRLVNYLGGESAGGTSRFEGWAGERVSVALPDADLSPRVRGPDGRTVPSRRSGGRISFVPDRPGAYALELAGGPVLAWGAVNTPLYESDVRRYDSLAEVEAIIEPSLFLRRVALAPWMLGLAGMLLVVQAAVGLNRRRHGA